MDNNDAKLSLSVLLQKNLSIIFQFYLKKIYLGTKMRKIGAKSVKYG